MSSQGDPPKDEAGGFPEPAGEDPGDRSSDPSPHHALGNPVGEPDPTEWPDPYEQRADPREPAEDMTGEERHTPTGSTSTSEPHPRDDIEASMVKPPERDRLDD